MKCGGLHKIENCGLRCSFYEGLGHVNEHCWEKKDPKMRLTTTNYLEMMVDDEEEVQNQLDRICGKNHDLFLHTRVPRQRVPMETIIGENGGVDVLEGDSSWRKDVGIGLE